MHTKEDLYCPWLRLLAVSGEVDLIIAVEAIKQ
jgi:hypothetical protein